MELLDNRQMLSAATDIIFLYDESVSGQDIPVMKTWLSEVVVDLDEQLDSSIADRQYGLVGFGENDNESYAHSHLCVTVHYKSPPIN